MATIDDIEDKVVEGWPLLTGYLDGVNREFFTPNATTYDLAKVYANGAIKAGGGELTGLDDGSVRNGQTQITWNIPVFPTAGTVVYSAAGDALGVIASANVLKEPWDGADSLEVGIVNQSGFDYSLAGRCVVFTAAPTIGTVLKCPLADGPMPPPDTTIDDFIEDNPETGKYFLEF